MLAKVLTPAWKSPLLALLLSGFCSSAVVGQAVRGSIRDAETGEPVIGARVRLLDNVSKENASTLSDSSGVFELRSAREGRYRITVEFEGYRPLEKELAQLRSGQVLQIEITLGRHVIDLNPLVVLGYRGDVLHAASYAGLYARRSRSFTVGNNRVILKSDPEFRSLIRVADILRFFKPLENCAIVFWHGFEVVNPERAAVLLALSAEEIEGVEIYTDVNAIPFEFRAQDTRNRLSPGRVRRCGVVALWPRRPQ